MLVPLDQVRTTAGAEARRVFSSDPTVEVDAGEGADWDGEPSLFLRIALPDHVVQAKDIGAKLLEASAAIRAALRKLGESRFPYVEIVAHSERSLARW